MSIPNLGKRYVMRSQQGLEEVLRGNQKKTASLC